MKRIYTHIILHNGIMNILIADIEPITNLQQHQPNIFALTHAKIQTKPNEIIENASIIIRGNRIEAVGDEIQIPSDAF